MFLSSSFLFFMMLFMKSPMFSLLFLVFGLIFFLKWMGFMKGLLLLLLYLGGMLILFVYIMSFSKMMNWSIMSFFILFFSIFNSEFEMNEMIFMNMYNSFFFLFFLFFLLLILLFFINFNLFYSKSLRLI